MNRDTAYASPELLEQAERWMREADNVRFYARKFHDASPDARKHLGVELDVALRSLESLGPRPIVSEKTR